MTWWQGIYLLTCLTNAMQHILTKTISTITNMWQESWEVFKVLIVKELFLNQWHNMRTVEVIMELVTLAVGLDLSSSEHKLTSPVPSCCNFYCPNCILQKKIVFLVQYSWHWINTGHWLKNNSLGLIDIPFKNHTMFYYKTFMNDSWICNHCNITKLSN